MSKHVVSYSEISTARQCPHKHLLAYRERWVGEIRSPALRRGTAWHKALEIWYRSLMLEPGAGRPVDVVDFLMDVDDTEERELLLWMWAGHLERYATDNQWQILAVEHAVEVALPTPKGNTSNIRLKAKIDLIVREHATQRIYVVDHKSARNMPGPLEFAIDDQFGLYVYAMRQTGVDVFGAQHSVARTQRNVTKPQSLEDRFARTRTYRTADELHTIAVEAYKTAAAVWYGGADYRSPNTDTCRWRCDYTEACLAGRKGLDERQMLEALGYRQDWTRH
jgi:hypothetical protein